MINLRKLYSMTSFGKSIVVYCAVFLTLASPARPAAAGILDGPDEAEIGRKTDKEIIRAYGLYDNEKIQEYVQRVGRKVLAEVEEPEFEYHFKVVNDPMVNAFALPGGYIYVARGALAVFNSEEDLAAVLGHEIGHVIGHHAVKMMKKSIGQTLMALGGLVASSQIRENAAAWLTVTSTLSQQIMLGYGRENEMESDQVGMLLAHEAGYNPDGMVNFLKSLRTMEKLGGQTYHGFSATHPDTISRIIEAEGKSGLLKNRGKEYVEGRDRYLDAIDGMQYGRAKWRGKTVPPYRIEIHTVQEGETFRSIAKAKSGDEGMALEIASLNAMNHNDPLEPGYRIKVIVPVETVSIREEKKDEVGPGTGNGKGGPHGRGKNKKTDRKAEKENSGDQE